MLNQTINQTISTSQNLTYDQVIQVTQHPVFLIALLIVWASIWISYTIIGCAIRAKTQDGRKLGFMIGSSNFWVAWCLMFFLQPALILLLIVFPFWLNWI